MRPTLYVLLGVLLVPTVGLVGDIVADGKFKSTKSTGPPLEVSSSEMVVNLNADEVDGLDASAFALTGTTYTKAQVDALLAAAVESARRKKYYLTNSSFLPDDAPDECGTGFHMPSLWKIADPSNFEYAFDHPNAASGSYGVGPPNYSFGWIRTGSWGGVSWENETPGEADCGDYVWGTGGSYFGAVAGLPHDWANPAGVGYALVWGTPWRSQSRECDESWRVWCVED